MIVDILIALKEAAGTNAKKEILRNEIDNELLKRVLLYANDPLMPFHVVKVPKVKNRKILGHSWIRFFVVADRCAARQITGNAAVEELVAMFSSVSAEEEKWMRKILKKHLAIGVSYKTINAVFPDLIPVFEVSLAQKFDAKRISHLQEFIIEPKLDGIRCLSIIENGEAKMFTRSGKLLTNFDKTIGAELLRLGDGCYDGELMGEDFTSLMRQAYRKENVNTDATYFAVFDFLPLEEWKTKKTKMSTHDRYEVLLDKMCDMDVDFKVITPVERQHCNDIGEIDDVHAEYVREGYEGAMIKDPDAPYRFGRSYAVMKLKDFHDVDLKIAGFVEGTGRHVGKLGAVVVNYEGVDVQVGSGFSDDLREQIWSNQNDFIGRLIEIRYQEVTPDGSLRFPTFVCFRNDRK